MQKGVPLYYVRYQVYNQFIPYPAAIMPKTEQTYSFATQTEILGFLNELEERFPVNQWKCDGVHIWPLIRLRLAGFLLWGNSNQSNSSEKKQNSKNRNVLYKVWNNLYKLVFSTKYFFWWLSIPKRRILFVGADHYRQETDGVRKNKFFDPLIERYDLDNFCWLDIGKTTNNPSWPNKGLDFHRGSLRFLKFRSLLRSIGLNKLPNIQLEEYENFLNFLQTNNETDLFTKAYSLEKLKSEIIQWHDYFVLFNRFLDKVEPARILLLCYFDLPRMALIAAANLKKITLTEIQHGTVDSIYYKNWLSLPKNGYDMLPRNYWCWDRFSKQTIDEWAAEHSLYRVFVGGNPWVAYWNDKDAGFDSDDPIILYTLQDLEPEDAFPKAIIQAIQETDETWYIRFHPNFLHLWERTDNFLQENGLHGKIKLKEAFELPLAVLLKHAKLHVSAYSSSSMEAALFGIHTIFLDRRTEDWFPSLYHQKFCTFLNANEPFFLKRFKNIRKNTEKKNGSELIRNIDMKAIEWSLNIE